MRSLTESPALLSLHQTGEGQYLVRVSDTRRRGLITTLIKALDDAHTITMVMPNDIKVFTVGGTNGSDPARAVVDSDSSTDMDAVERPPVTDPETLAAIAAEERTPLPNAAAESEVEVEEAAPAPRARRRPKPTSVSGHPESCGRCSGSGHIKMMLDGGQAGETTCPVCRGEGQITRYGARR